MNTATVFRIGSRKSPLAQWQSKWVGQRLQTAGYRVQYCHIQAHGDQLPQAPFSEISIQGIFTKALEKALLDGAIDVAVHSAKDLPATETPGFRVLAFTARELPHDVLVTPAGAPLRSTQGGARIGTSSVRRAAQLAHYFPNMKVVPIRGNIETRLDLLSKGHCEAVVLAYAALFRSQYTHGVLQSLHPAFFVPAVGQGSLAIEVRDTLPQAQQKALRNVLNHPETELALRAERAFLAQLGAGCQVPAFGLATLRKNLLHLHAGRYYQGKCLQLQKSAPATKPEPLGKAIALHILEKMSPL